MNIRALLLPLDGNSPIEISKDMTLIGRKEECDLRLDHKSVSKIHCVLVKTDGLLFVRDLGSTNGTRVNGTRVRRAALLPNDKLSVAQFHFKLHIGPNDPPAGPREVTQQIQAEDGTKKGKEELGESSVDHPIIQVQMNALPDVYPDSEEEEPKKKKPS